MSQLSDYVDAVNAFRLISRPRQVLFTNLGVERFAEVTDTGTIVIAESLDGVVTERVEIPLAQLDTLRNWLKSIL